MSDDEKQRLIDASRATHGRVIVLEAPGDEWDPDVFVIAKRPPRGEWKRYRAMLFDETDRPNALETLTRACVVYPPPSEFAAMLLEQPALAEQLGNKLTEAAGSGREVESKKY